MTKDGLWVTKSEGVGLIIREISFQDFQRCAITIHQRLRQTDRRHVIFNVTSLNPVVVFQWIYTVSVTPFAHHFTPFSSILPLTETSADAHKKRDTSDDDIIRNIAVRRS